ncbi:MAG TPA: TIR domain-containing protein [Novosphingobium sp.]|nr:TIR domain-containing protein [Novosphingobium sp.]
MDADGKKAATVFLSYARADQKRALPVIKALEQAGIEVWWDGLIEGGDSFLPTTEAALEDADAVVVLWSKTSVDSHWVRDEATRGRDRGCLVPLSIDGTHPPLGFRQFQVIDFAKWRGRQDATELRRALRAIHGFAGHAAPHPAPAAAARGRIDRRMVIGGGAALLAGGAALAVWKGGLIGGADSPGNSVAVLPFRNLSGDPAQDFFAEGIAEQIRTTLSRNEKLLVLAPASIASVAKDGVEDLAAIAEKLGVAFLLGGSVRRSGDQLRIAATLTDAKSGFSSWNEQFEKRLEDVFAVQDEIADAVAAVMAAQTAGGGKSNSRELGGTSSVRAYDAYLRGNAFYNLRSGEAAYRSALAQYDAALERDADFALALAARARVIVVLTNNYAQASQFKAAYDDALASARKAVQLAPQLASAQSTLGYVLVQAKLDLKGAWKHHQEARRLGSGDAGVLNLYSAYMAQMGRKREAAEGIERAIKLDPLNPGVFRIAAFVAYCARDYPRVIEHARKGIALNPKMESIHAYLGDALLQLGKPEEARAEYLREGGGLRGDTGLAIVEHKLGNAAAAQAAMDALIKAFGDATTYQQAQILAQWGEADKAMAKLAFAREIGDVGLAQAYTDPLLDPLRGRPDFSRLLTELGFG